MGDRPAPGNAPGHDDRHHRGRDAGQHAASLRAPAGDNSGLRERISRKQLDLSSTSIIRGIARRFGIRFRKKWGQSFLADRQYLERLVDALELASDDQVVEIGPGLGVLTSEVANRTALVIAVEIDPACVRALSLTLRGIPNVRVIEGDILKQSLATLVTAPYRVIGNIPYSLTGALFPYLLEQTVLPGRIDLVVQREVAERLAAPPGSWSLATLGVRVYGRPQVVLVIPRRAFYPQPQVDSALVRIVPEENRLLPRPDLPAFFRFARPFFQVRRKQLPYVLVRSLGIGNAEARARLQAIGIEPTRRPETLSLDEWARLFRAEHPNWTNSG